METGKRKSYPKPETREGRTSGVFVCFLYGAQCSQKGSLMAFWFLGGRRNTAPCHRRHFSQTGCPGVDLSAPSSHKAFIQCPGASESDLLSAIRRPNVWNKIPSFQKQMQVEPLIRPSPPPLNPVPPQTSPPSSAHQPTGKLEAILGSPSDRKSVV